jgi:hypothetical protein
MTNSNKRGSGADPLYRNHLRGTNFHNNVAENRQGLIERMYLRIIGELAMNRFKWEGLPEEVDVRFLELTLYNFALSIFFQDTGNIGNDRSDTRFFNGSEKYFALQGGASGPLNMMQQPLTFRATGNNFVGITLTKDECVPIWANYYRVPDLDLVSVYANRLASMSRTVEINAISARRNKVVVTSENLRHTAAQINRQIEDGQGVITVGDALGSLTDMVTALDLGVHPDSVVNMQIAKTREWNECMGYLGIENANQDKKERLVASEVDANNEQSSMFRYVNLNARQIACEQINKKYKLDVSVEYNTQVDAMAAAYAPGTEDVNADMTIESEGS